MSVDQRRHARYPVRIQVRFTSALAFLTEYADNLSAGGLFVRGAHRLEPQAEVEVELALPGFGTHKLRGKVAHIVTPEMAEAAGRRPGAGLEILEQPVDFARNLAEYLRRLGRRRDVAVMVDLSAPLGLLTGAGYQLLRVPPPHELVAEMSRSSHPVIAVVVAPDKEAIYRAAAASAGIGDLVRVLDGEDEVDPLLGALDALL